MCLFLSEVVLPTSNSSAPIHASGIGDLLQLHDPDFYSSGISHQLFVGFRPVMFIHVFMSRQKSFLAEAQWLHAPFSKSGIAPLQNLFSEMINMPHYNFLVSLLPTISPTFGRFILFAHKTSDKSDTSSPA
ncbi:hypothetical protein HYQ46_011998 [Verticillium longisporum]|nr:hypothetical protein HYQ46_011998 [Verticillium longisporum]